ncbi:hypothetical protein SLEP1_g6843 [Rubroshorea leprosula]|uniref:Uncharacterized protein n=1 Tax=Rubroshorea leprosula TaxID=152421 RepID=A0AAV5I7G2_9ROSI|nr:hypothetical protein SLEP1_g6843 [Rubroshorea leprosula]
MDAIDSVFDPLRDFAKNSVRLVKRIVETIRIELYDKILPEGRNEHALLLSFLRYHEHIFSSGFLFFAILSLVQGASVLWTKCRLNTPLSGDHPLPPGKGRSSESRDLVQVDAGYLSVSAAVESGLFSHCMARGTNMKPRLWRRPKLTVDGGESDVLSLETAETSPLMVSSSTSIILEGSPLL